MTAYRKKPVVIEAVQWDGQNRAEIEAFAGESLDEAWSVGGYCFINTLEGRMAAGPGDWIIRGVAGELYPCKPDIFDQTYELASPQTPVMERLHRSLVALRLEVPAAIADDVAANVRAALAAAVDAGREQTQRGDPS